jgi:hypothetical protein
MFKKFSISSGLEGTPFSIPTSTDVFQCKETILRLSTARAPIA